MRLSFTSRSKEVVTEDRASLKIAIESSNTTRKKREAANEKQQHLACSTRKQHR
jgi:hypothetical protein